MEDIQMSNARNQLNYSNDLFFKYALSREDEDSVYARNTITECAAGIRIKENIVLNPDLDPGIIGKKHIILDVHMKDEQNRYFNIEMQTAYKGLVEMIRFEFYDTKASNNQLRSGELYDQLEPACQIVFIDKYAWSSRNLTNQHQMHNEQGENEGCYPLILRTFVHMPVINDITKEKEMQRLNDFEQLVYLFEDNGKNDILKSKERLVKIFMDKYEEVQEDGELQSTVMMIQMEEARYRNGLRGSSEEGRTAGKVEGRIKGKLERERQLLYRQMQIKFHKDRAMWLQALTEEQMHIVSTLVLECDTFESIKERISKPDTTI